MKKLLIVIIFFIIWATTKLSSQINYLNITDLTFGYDLGAKSTNPLYSERIIGFTTINGYRVSLSDFSREDFQHFYLPNNYFTGIGTGVYIYKEGYLVPLFIDLRYWLPVRRVTPYVFGDAGLLFCLSDFNKETRMFVNPGFGACINVGRKLVINTSLGLNIQMGNNKPRAAYANFNAGIYYRFFFWKADNRTKNL